MLVAEYDSFMVTRKHHTLYTARQNFQFVVDFSGTLNIDASECPDMVSQKALKSGELNKLNNICAWKPWFSCFFFTFKTAKILDFCFCHKFLILHAEVYFLKKK